jgi:hypothetical protein
VRPDDDRKPYDLNIGRFKTDHPRHQVAIGFEGFGFRARPAEGKGPWVSALTLDELDAKLKEPGAR